MPHQDVALLNSRCFVRWNRDQDVDEPAHAPTSCSRESDGVEAQITSDTKGFQNALRISRSADSNGHVSGDGECLKLSREHVFVTVIVGDGRYCGGVGMKHQSR